MYRIDGVDSALQEWDSRTRLARAENKRRLLWIRVRKQEGYYGNS